MLAPGFAGNISDVLVDGARFYGSSMAVAIKSLPSFGGFVRNVTWRNIELHEVSDTSKPDRMFGC